MTTVFGTLEFAAPEITHPSAPMKGYSCKVDMWSLGIIVHVLLTNTMPPNPVFNSSGNESMVSDSVSISQKLQSASKSVKADLKPSTQIQKQRPIKRTLLEPTYQFQYPGNSKSDLDDTQPVPVHSNPYTRHISTDSFWHNISPLARDFVNDLLQQDEANRMSAEQAQRHPWLNRHQKELDALWKRATARWESRKDQNEVWIEEFTATQINRVRCSDGSVSGEEVVLDMGAMEEDQEDYEETADFEDERLDHTQQEYTRGKRNSTEGTIVPDSQTSIVDNTLTPSYVSPKGNDDNISPPTRTLHRVATHHQGET